MKKLKVYVASPMGFCEATRVYMYKTVIPMLESLGLEIIDPWKLTPQEEVDTVLAITDFKEREEALGELRFKIGQRNAAGIEESNFMVANLDGQEVDSGTSGEIGAEFQSGKTVFGWRSDYRASGELGGKVNLQVEYFVLASGGSISTSLEELRQTLVEFLSNS